MVSTKQKDLFKDPGLSMVRQACKHIENSSDGPPTLTELSSTMNVSPGHLHRVFRRIMGITPRQYADAHRQDRLKARLREGWGVTDAMYESGYGSSSRLYESSTDSFGMTPASYGKGGAGAEISYAIVDSPLGRLLIAATSKGICSVKLGDSDPHLESELRTEFSDAEIHRDSGELQVWVEAFLDYLSGSAPSLNLPVDVRATAFQRQVWELLRSIPYGQTRSYHEVARAMGHPKAARAVGGACASNPVALVIPCHRVVREDGNLGGYRWGLGRKSRLLAQERGRRRRDK